MSGFPSQTGEHYVHPSAEWREEMEAQQVENAFHPYNNEGQYHLAKVFASPKIHPEATIHLACVDGRNKFLLPDTAFSSHADFIGRLDQMAKCYCPWKEREIKPRAGQESGEWYTSVRYWAKDSLAVLQEILDNPELKGKCVWAPAKEFNSEGERVYTDMHTGDWWMNIQVSCQDYGYPLNRQAKVSVGGASSKTVIPIILSSDKTQLGSLSGDASAWPLYMSIGNVIGSERFRKENHAMRLIGLLPTLTGTALIGKMVLIQVACAQILRHRRRIRTGKEVSSTM